MFKDQILVFLDDPCIQCLDVTRRVKNDLNKNNVKSAIKQLIHEIDTIQFMSPKFYSYIVNITNLLTH